MSQAIGVRAHVLSRLLAMNAEILKLVELLKQPAQQQPAQLQQVTRPSRPAPVNRQQAPAPRRRGPYRNTQNRHVQARGKSSTPARSLGKTSSCQPWCGAGGNPCEVCQPRGARA